jgi:hypothetical protein
MSFAAALDDLRQKTSLQLFRDLSARRVSGEYNFHVLQGCATVYWTCEWPVGINRLIFNANIKNRSPVAPKDDQWLLLALDAYAFFVKDVIEFASVPHMPPGTTVYFRDTDPLLRAFLQGAQPPPGRPPAPWAWQTVYDADKGSLPLNITRAINPLAYNTAHSLNPVPASELGCPTGTPVSALTQLVMDKDDLLFRVLGLKWWPWRRRYYSYYTPRGRRAPAGARRAAAHRSALGKRIVGAVDRARNPGRIIVLGKPGKGAGYTDYMRQIRADHPDVPVHFRKWGQSARQFLRENPIRKRNLVITTNPTRASPLEWERSAGRGRQIGSAVRSIGRRGRRSEYFDGDLDTDYTSLPAPTTLGVSLGGSLATEGFGDYYY